MCAFVASMELEVSRPRTERGAVVGGGGAAMCAFVASMELEVSRPRTERGAVGGGCHMCICSQYGTRGE